jgi:predicted acyl esterase
VAWAEEELRWWREWLMGEPTGIMREPALWAFMPYASADTHPVPGRWISEPRWPVAGRTRMQWHLAGSGLVMQPGDTARFTFVAGHPVGLDYPEWLPRMPAEQTDDDAHSLVFDTAPLQANIELLGAPQAILQIAAYGAIRVVAVRLNEVRPDGRSELLSCGQQSLAAGHDGEVVVPLALMARRVQAGSRLRLAISDGLWPLSWPVVDSGDPGTFTLSTRGSALALPVRPQEAKPLAPPFTVNDRDLRPAPVTPGPALSPDGWYRYEHDSPPIEYVDPEVATRLTRSRIARAA